MFKIKTISFFRIIYPHHINILPNLIHHQCSLGNEKIKDEKFNLYSKRKLCKNIVEYSRLFKKSRTFSINYRFVNLINQIRRYLRNNNNKFLIIFPLY